MDMVTKVSMIVIILFLSTFGKAQTYTLEAPGTDPTLVVRGDEIRVELFNKMDRNKVFIFKASEYTNLSGTNLSGIVVDDKFVVITIVKQEKINKKKLPEQSCFIGCIAGSPQESFFFKKFSKGDLCKFRKDGDVLDWQDIPGKESLSFKLLNDNFATVSESNFIIEGQVNSDNKEKFYLKTGNKTITPVFSNNNKFTYSYSLKEGVNYINFELWDRKSKLSDQELVVYYNKSPDVSRQLVLWIEQFPNAKTLTSDHAIDSMLAFAKQAGFNTIALDVKGPEGYVSYRKNNYSHSPYFTSTKNPKKKTVDTGFDLLASMIRGVRKLDLKIIVSFNFFTEGNITSQDFAILEKYPEWEEIVQRPEDKGLILKISESVAGKEAKAGKRIALAFVNPANKTVQDFQLLRVKEVLENYDIDGIVLDRTRYDNLYADFSETSKNAFSNYLHEKGKKLNHFPDDVFRIDEKGVLQEGSLFTDWITFRSSVIRDFTARVRKQVDQHNGLAGKNIKLAAYVGSWYESYYQNGVNWAHPEFKYQSSLKFPKAEIYTSDYAETSYIPYLDFLMIGTYYKTDKEIMKYTTLGNILTAGKLPLLAGISLPDLKEENQAEVFRSAVKNSSGIMIFDLCYVDWSNFSDRFKQNTNIPK